MEKFDIELCYSPDRLVGDSEDLALMAHYYYGHGKNGMETAFFGLGTMILSESTSTDTAKGKDDDLPDLID